MNGIDGVLDFSSYLPTKLRGDARVKSTAVLMLISTVTVSALNENFMMNGQLRVVRRNGAKFRK